MNDRNRAKARATIFAVFLVLIFCIRKYSDLLQERNMLIPLLIVLFVGGFGLAGYLVAKMWKTSDEEFLDLEKSGEENTASGTTKKQRTYDDHKRNFFGSLAFIAVVLFQQDRLESHILIFCGVVLLVGIIAFLPAWIQKRRGKEGQPLFPKVKIKLEQVFITIVGLIGVCFAAFFCYTVITGLPLKIAIPCLFPPMILGGVFARPLVAGLRILFRREKDPGEKHISKRKDSDPWDRPDRKL